jgi:hypothetical protein
MDEIKEAARNLLAALINNKPNDRSEADRRYAILITEVEKVMACIFYFFG